MKVEFEVGEDYGKLVSRLLEQVNQLRAKQNLPPLTMNQWGKMVFVNAVSQDLANFESTP